MTSKVIYRQMEKLIQDLTKVEYENLQNFTRLCSHKKQETNIILKWQSTQGFFIFNNQNEEIKLKINEVQNLRDAYLKSEGKIIMIDRSWLQRFTSKYGLSYRKITHLSIKTQEETQAAIPDFLQEIHVLRKEEKIPPELIFNFDETAIFYDIIPNSPYELKGTRHPALKTSKLKKKRLTAGLAIASSGITLKPILIFKGFGVRVNTLENTRNYVIKKDANAWMTNKLFFDYIQEVVIPYVNNQRLNSEFKGKKGLIIVDNFSGHKLDEKQSQALDKAGIILKFLKPYTTSTCQPLDLNINYIIKSKMRNEWMTWFDKNPEENIQKQTI